MDDLLSDGTQRLVERFTQMVRTLTQQAAQILNVSRPYLYRLIEEHAVPVVMVGSHRRLRIHDVLQLREQRHQVRRSALDELSDLGQELQVEAV